MLINKKDIIGINKEVGCNGQFGNESSLDLALSIVKQKKSWLFELSYIVRSLLVDHVFQDGNKRTASVVITTFFDQKNLDYDKEKIVKIILQISKKNINDINKTMRLIKNVIIP
jgi:prophage maintenance system killer protein